MHLVSFFFDKHRGETVLVIAVTLSIFLLTREEDSKFAVAKNVSSFLLYPVQKIDDYLTDIEEVKRENRKLRELSAALYHEREKLLEFKRERNRLRKLLELRKDSLYEFLACEVIARSANRFLNSITIDRGGEDGVKTGMAVVGYRGLVGRVNRVFPSSARVLTINNRSVRVSCRDKRSRVIGVLEWERGNLFRLDYIGREEDVLPGDTLITSGQGRLFPAGFPVGIVYRATDNKASLTRQVWVSSITNLDTLEDLFVIVGGKGWESDSLYNILEDLNTAE